ncbi:uncharacterized protein LOC18020531 [Eutrema salsugineum]|uniref:uncharacterized protein LOC18020531 n=1 Tax=Eutrema salsugineum TaxID=72664 RepID=UPI000CED0431|nr:uncharacterized protein LOC18020531 [Eutrema salsugineum]
MFFFSFLGRVLFASLFIFSAWQMFNGFGVDGGLAAKELALKLDLHKEHLSSRLEVRQAIVTIVSLIAVGVSLFVIGKIFGAYLAFYFMVVGPIMYDIYNYGPEGRHFSPFLIEVLQNVAQFGALFLFFSK